MSEIKVRLSMEAPGTSMLSSQDCEKMSKKEAYDHTILVVEQQVRKGKKLVTEKETLHINTRKSKPARQCISISKEAYSYMTDAKEIPSARLLKTWGNMTAALLRENFQLEQLTSGLKYPETIVKAVNAKNEAIQRAQQAQNEVAVAEANAKKLLVAAQAEAEANRLKQQALTPQILEKMWIEKWDGKLPVYGQVPTLFRDISK